MAGSMKRGRTFRPLSLSTAATDALLAYDWPGNVRELERVIERAVALAGGPFLELDDLPPALLGDYAEGDPAVMDWQITWAVEHGIPVAGRIEAPGTVDGGDTFWLRPDMLCIGRSLRTNDVGARQLADLVGGEVLIFDLPYWRGPAELVHLLSVISPVTDDLAVIYAPLLPAGLWQLLGELGIRTIAVPDDEFPTLGCNVLAVRPGVLIMADGNPVTQVALEAAGCEVHTYSAAEIGINGSGGPTCMARPILRDS